jgi:hypothetical protein
MDDYMEIVLSECKELEDKISSNISGILTQLGGILDQKKEKVATGVIRKAADGKIYNTRNVGGSNLQIQQQKQMRRELLGDDDIAQINQSTQNVGSEMLVAMATKNSEQEALNEARHADLLREFEKLKQGQQELKEGQSIIKSTQEEVKVKLGSINNNISNVKEDVKSGFLKMTQFIKTDGCVITNPSTWQTCIIMLMKLLMMLIVLIGNTMRMVHNILVDSVGIMAEVLGIPAKFIPIIGNGLAQAIRIGLFVMLIAIELELLLLFISLLMIRLEPETLIQAVYASTLATKELLKDLIKKLYTLDFTFFKLIDAVVAGATGSNDMEGAKWNIIKLLMRTCKCIMANMIGTISFNLPLVLGGSTVTIWTPPEYCNPEEDTLINLAENLTNTTGNVKGGMLNAPPQPQMLTAPPQPKMLNSPKPQMALNDTVANKNNNSVNKNNNNLQTNKNKNNSNIITLQTKFNNLQTNLQNNKPKSNIVPNIGNEPNSFELNKLNKLNEINVSNIETNTNTKPKNVVNMKEHVISVDTIVNHSYAYVNKTMELLDAIQSLLNTPIKKTQKAPGKKKKSKTKTKTKRKTKRKQKKSSKKKKVKTLMPYKSKKQLSKKKVVKKQRFLNSFKSKFRNYVGKD